MNYWPAYMSNLAETAKPMINYIDDMRYYGRIALKNTQVSNPKKVKKTVGWFILRRHHLAGQLQVGIITGVGLLLPMLG